MLSNPMKTPAFLLTVTAVLCQIASAQTIKDSEGNTYKTIQVGNKTVMAENLRATRFRNGDAIPLIINNSDWGACEKTKKCAYSYYDNQIENQKKYGNLYNSYTVQDKRNLCPSGWRVPTNDEWAAIYPQLTGENKILFTAQLSGSHSWNGEYKSLTKELLLWSSTLGTVYGAYLLWFTEEGFKMSSFSEENGLAVRCIKADDATQATSAPAAGQQTTANTGTPVPTQTKAPSPYKYTDGRFSITFPTNPEVSDNYHEYSTIKVVSAALGKREYFANKITFSKKAVDLMHGSGKGYEISAARRKEVASAFGCNATSPQASTYKYKFGSMSYSLYSPEQNGRVKEIYIDESTLYEIIVISSSASDNIDNLLNEFISTVEIN